MGSGEPIDTAVSDSFDRFYRTEVDRIQRSLTVTLRSPDLAADATAEAMARAYASWPKVSAYDNPSAWVYRVGLNWSTSIWRKRRREVLSADDRDAPVVLAGHDETLDRALSALPVQQRAVVVLRYLLDWSEVETAAALGVAPGTVKSRLSRALARLAELLEDDHGPSA